MALDMLGVTVRLPEAPITDANPACGIRHPVEVVALQPGLALPVRPVLRCAAVAALAAWWRGEVVPAAAALPGRPQVTKVAFGSLYDCRDTVGNSDGAKLSQHALGNAVDIGTLTLSDGSRLEIAPGPPVTPAAAALRAMEAGACLHFTTVLGPASNAAHAGHLHLDVKPRRDGTRLCE